MNYTTPLRYPGGKSRLAGFIELIIELNSLSGGKYVEPYAGGAGLALHLLFSGHADHIYINDLNKSIYAFWNSVLTYPEDICRLIRDTPIDMNSWLRQKVVQDDSVSYSELELGFSTLFLNRTNRSGIIKGGVIGGKNQQGPYKLDVRFNKIDLISRIMKIAANKNKISLSNQDAVDFINTLMPSLSENTLLYLDPPYYKKGHELYENHYKHSDHAEIADLLAQIQCPWIISYDDVAEIRELYQGHLQVQYNPSYSASKHYRGSEIMYFNDRLIVPGSTNDVNPIAALA